MTDFWLSQDEYWQKLQDRSFVFWGIDHRNNDTFIEDMSSNKIYQVIFNMETRRFGFTEVDDPDATTS